MVQKPNYLNPEYSTEKRKDYAIKTIETKTVKQDFQICRCLRCNGHEIRLARSIYAVPALANEHGTRQKRAKNEEKKKLNCRIFYVYVDQAGKLKLIRLPFAKHAPTRASICQNKTAPNAFFSNLDNSFPYTAVWSTLSQRIRVIVACADHMICFAHET